MIIIRNATPEDTAAVTDIEAMCFPAVEAAGYMDFSVRIKVFPESFFVAEDQTGTMAGFVNGGCTAKPYLPDEMYHDIALHHPDGAWQTVFGLNVLPDYRRQGIAEQLVGRMIASARERGKAGIVLTCKDHMVHYYTKFGFENKGRADSRHGGATWNDMRLTF